MLVEINSVLGGPESTQSDEQVILHPRQVKSAEELRVGGLYMPMWAMVVDGGQRFFLERFPPFEVTRLDTSENEAAATAYGTSIDKIQATGCTLGYYPEEFGLGRSPFSTPPRYLVGSILIPIEEYLQECKEDWFKGGFELMLSKGYTQVTLMADTAYPTTRADFDTERMAALWIFQNNKGQEAMLWRKVFKDGSSIVSETSLVEGMEVVNTLRKLRRRWGMEEYGPFSLLGSTLSENTGQVEFNVGQEYQSTTLIPNAHAAEIVSQDFLRERWRTTIKTGETVVYIGTKADLGFGENAAGTPSTRYFRPTEDVFKRMKKEGFRESNLLMLGPYAARYMTPQ